jgi:hypothetical protein
MHHHPQCSNIVSPRLHPDPPLHLPPLLQVAVVVPDPEVLLPWAKDRGMSQDLAQLCREAAVVAAVHKGMLEEGRAAQLRGFEQVGEQAASGLAGCRHPSCG